MRTEKEILEDFEKLGYTVENNKLRLYIQTDTEQIVVNKKGRYLWASSDLHEEFIILMREFKLLHELFVYWGWLDE